MKQKTFVVKTALLFLAICLLTVTASAAENRTLSPSEDIITMIANFEGYTPHYTGGYIGYGTAVSAGEYPDGITREEARELLRSKLEYLGGLVQDFFTARGVTLTQQQFDALCDLAYNIGPSCLKDDYRYVKAIVSGNYTDNEIASAIGVLCHSNGKVLTGLANRRAADVAVFLYGDYALYSGRFRYVIFDAGDGEVFADVYMYADGLPYSELPEAEWSGHVFSGWYTEDGTKLTASTMVTQNLSVTARWDCGTNPEITLEVSATSGLSNFMRVRAYTQGIFTDVDASNTFAENVRCVFEQGLMTGKTASYFGIGQNMTRMAGIIIACRIHRIYYVGVNDIETRYSGSVAERYLAYAKENGIYCDFDNVSTSITRAEYAAVLSSALPDEALVVINTVSNGALRDVTSDNRYVEAIYRLYRAGVLTGYSNDTFAPDAWITRGAACAIASRMANSGLRITRATA